MTKEEHNKIKDGEYFWGIDGFIQYDQDYSINVFVKSGGRYFEAGNWEGETEYHKLNLIEKIQKPSQNIISEIITKVKDQNQ